MNWHEEENRAKLHILISLARSQRAVARIIESMADMIEGATSSGDASEQVISGSWSPSAAFSSNCLVPLRACAFISSVRERRASLGLTSGSCRPGNSGRLPVAYRPAVTINCPV
ncbi:hypothetical protein [Paenibacillus piri]|uniref:hypothetical protein n=1 Tax=Paenibacillus piri TaxID=2547395 RepID=UPI001FE4FF8A|nr:hypothetical protein [Paenibacillus piri]